MLTRWLLAAVHLIALGVGLGAVWARARLLSGSLDAGRLRLLFAADAWWGLAAVLWIGSGLWRLLGETEKGLGYYVGNHVFWTKMALLAGIIAMEIRPAITIARWRRQAASGRDPDTAGAARLARISSVQAFLVVAMVLAATAMARGLGAP